MEYTNNDPESANFVIKHGLQFCAQKPHEFIQKIKDIVETQQRNEDRAVFGKGQYRLREEFQHLSVDDHHRSQLSHLQMKKKLSLYLKAGMKEKKNVMAEVPEDENEEKRSVSEFEMAVRSSNILNVPGPILDGMISKAGDLLSSPANVIQTPGATDGSYVVAGSANKIHSVKPGRGGSWTCDRTCINRSTKICEHTLAVAHVSGTLKEFLIWFGRTRKRPNMMGMVEDGGPKSAGKKRSTRKRSNIKSRPINEYVDIFDREEHERHEKNMIQNAVDTSFPSMVPSPFTDQISTVFSQPIRPCSSSAYPAPLHSSSSHSMSSLYQVRPTTPSSSSVPSLSVPAYPAPLHSSSSHSMSSPYQIRPTTPSSSSVPSLSVPAYPAPLHSSSSHSMSSPYQVRPTTPSSSSVPSLSVPAYSAPLHSSSSHSMSSPYQLRPTTPRQHPECQPSGIFQPPSTPGPNKFNLKWVSGPRVSKCYGCDMKISNPPEFVPDDLIVVYRDVREYRDRITGQIHRSASAQNVHFHLRAGCILKRYPHFNPGLLNISADFIRSMLPEHLQRLFTEFGWTNST